MARLELRTILLSKKKYKIYYESNIMHVNKMLYSFLNRYTL